MKKKKTEEIKPTFIKLPYKQELFCRYFIETSGNKTHSALLAFDVKNRELGLKLLNKEYLKDDELLLANRAYFCASVMGCEYFEKPKIKKRVDELIENEYFTDGIAKREHTKILLQDKDLSTKKGAIEMYYKLKGKFAPEEKKITHNIDIPNYKNLSNEELKKLEAEVMKELK